MIAKQNVTLCLFIYIYEGKIHLDKIEDNYIFKWMYNKNLNLSDSKNKN